MSNSKPEDSIEDALSDGTIAGITELLNLCISDPDKAEAIVEMFVDDHPAYVSNHWVLYCMGRVHLYKALHLAKERGGEVIEFDEVELDILQIALGFMTKIEEVKPGWLKICESIQKGVGMDEVKRIGEILEKGGRLNPNGFRKYFNL